MKQLEYSPVVKRKLKALQQWLTDHFGEDTAHNVLTGIKTDTELLEENEECGIKIAEMYDIDTDYYYLFTHQHYLVYRIESEKIVIVQMFHEREDFMMKLFGMSGRTQESIDYWGD